MFPPNGLLGGKLSGSGGNKGWLEPSITEGEMDSTADRAPV
jgi:hypothetical protein